MWKYLPITGGWEKEDSDVALKCAMVLADEVVDVLSKIHLISEVGNALDYWKEVKQEIGRLLNMFFDSNGIELKEGDVFEYTSKKWKSKARIVSKNGDLGTIITQRDMPDRFIRLEKYLKRHYVTKVS